MRKNICFECNGNGKRVDSSIFKDCIYCYGTGVDMSTLTEIQRKDSRKAWQLRKHVFRSCLSRLINDPKLNK